MPVTEQMLLDRWPMIPWLEPISVNGRYACRLCIAQYGLKAADIGSLPTTPDDVLAHLFVCHPTVAKAN